jgi:hypothetical protein
LPCCAVAAQFHCESFTHTLTSQISWSCRGLF